MAQINIAGERIFNVILILAYWVVLIAGSGAIINAISKKDVQGALKLALSHGVAFASLFILRWVLDLIKEIFG